LTDRPLGHFQIVDALLPNYTKCSPIAIKEADPGTSVKGRLILNIDQIDLVKLDEYESCSSYNSDSEDESWYNRKLVTVITKRNEKLNAFAYIPNF